MSEILSEPEIQNLIVSLDSNFDEIKEDHLKSAYNFVVEKVNGGQTISQPAYKFVCWLSHNNKELFPSPVNEPHIPEISEMSLNEFSGTFCFNVHRIELFEKLEVYLKCKNTVFNCPHIDLLIGGSFVDLNNGCPSDIDCGILLSRDIIDTYTAACDNYTREYQGKEIDGFFLYEDYTLKQYRAFVWLTMLGNVPMVKDKENADSTNTNSFEAGKVYKVRFELEVID